MKMTVSLTAALLAGGLVTQAQDWPQWGGNDPGLNMLGMFFAEEYMLRPGSLPPHWGQS